MKIKLDSEVIAEVRSALDVILLAAQTLDVEVWSSAINKLEIIEEQVKRIDKLLPQVKFEGDIENDPKSGGGEGRRKINGKGKLEKLG